MSQSSVVLSAALFALAACGQPPTTKTAKPSAPNEERVSPRLAAAPSVPVEGWETDPFVFSRIGSTLPAFKSGQPNRPELTQENLRGRWTIIGFATPDATSEKESTFIAALNSAADQDPDLDFLQVNRAPAGVASAWPTIVDDGTIMAGTGIEKTPAYLLVGPDLTIEGYRGALSETPDDGIKSVIRGVTEIRKQIAAPE
jgi:hypothetical protein